MLAEKVLPFGRAVARVTGGLLFAGGVYVLAAFDRILPVTSEVIAFTRRASQVGVLAGRSPALST